VWSGLRKLQNKIEERAWRTKWRIFEIPKKSNSSLSILSVELGKLLLGGLAPIVLPPSLSILSVELGKLLLAGLAPSVLPLSLGILAEDQRESNERY
jgi:hypothetical protein